MKLRKERKGGFVFSGRDDLCFHMVTTTPSFIFRKVHPYQYIIVCLCKSMGLGHALFVDTKALLDVAQGVLINLVRMHLIFFYVLLQKKRIIMFFMSVN